MSAELAPPRKPEEEGAPASVFSGASLGMSHLVRTAVVGSGPFLGKSNFIFVCPHLQTTCFQAFAETSGHKVGVGVGRGFLVSQL